MMKKATNKVVLSQVDVDVNVLLLNFVDVDDDVEITNTCPNLSSQV